MFISPIAFECVDDAFILTRKLYCHRVNKKIPYVKLKRYSRAFDFENICHKEKFKKNVDTSIKSLIHYP
jgi:hypothetical protein